MSYRHAAKSYTAANITIHSFTTVGDLGEGPGGPGLLHILAKKIIIK